MGLLFSGCSVVLTFAIYSYKNYATLDASYKIFSKLSKSSLQLLKQ